MQEHDARVLRGAAIPTAVVGLIAMIVAFAIAGTHGLIGAVLGTLLVIVFFAVSAVIIAWTGERRPELLLPVAFLVYTTKVGILAAALILFKGTTAFDSNVLALTTLACVIAWLSGHAFMSMRVKRPYVEPVSDAEPVEEQR
ncbi:hypothetical protein CDO52_23170 [Nocardiopsis gilva YIM 90087]|uniref:ATP synthase protein I n=1 Tax=Nocardiopsis gilva YIM 90087 TaxID=1235441 RepID=A0A223SB46_9ACTN|nr:hypothetical protein [Nocardiopsis gilva]ASU85306.1 hypothetical protein CDO52_23170 [Nocardiopsis gilva YIM 90087]